MSKVASQPVYQPVVTREVLTSWNIEGPDDVLSLESSYRELKKRVVAAVGPYADYAVSVETDPAVFSSACKDMMIGNDPSFDKVLDAYSRVFSDLMAASKKLPNLWRAEAYDQPKVFVSHKNDDLWVESSEYTGRLADAKGKLEYADTVVLVADFVAKKLAPSSLKSGYESMQDEIETQRQLLLGVLRSGKR